MDEYSTVVITRDGIMVDFSVQVLRDPAGGEVPLRAKSFAVLRHLVENAGRTVSKDELNEVVWGGAAVTDDSLVQCIGDIRRAMGGAGRGVLKTIPKRGYRLDLPATDTASPRRARMPWRIAAGGAALVALALVAAGASWREPASGGPPSIAVLPFDDMSAAQDLGYMGDGLAEDVISMLARSPDVLVMARNSSFVYGDAPVDVRKVGAELGVDYVLEGSVRREGDALRVVAQLNDASTGAHLWAERFDQTGADPPAMMDAVSGRIIGTLAGEYGELKRAQHREAWGKDSADLAEYDYFLRGLDVYMNASDKPGYDRAGAILREGLEKYPDSALIKTKLAWVHWTLAWDFYSDDLTADFREAGRLVTEVLAMDDIPPEARRIAYWLNALVLMQRGDFDASVTEAERAVAMAPYDARMLRFLTEVLLASGKYDTALEWLAIAEPREPGRAERYHQMRGNLYRLMGRYEDARRELELAQPLRDYPRLILAITYVRLGRLEDARSEVRSVLAENPSWTQALWREGSFYSDPAILDAEIADLAAAGVPQ